MYKIKQRKGSRKKEEGKKKERHRKNTIQRIKK